MTQRTLPKGEWRSYFDRISKRIRSASVETSVAGLDLGDQTLTSKALFEGVTYEPATEMLTFYFEGLTHDIAAPREVVVDDAPGGLRSIAVLDSEGHKQVAVFSDLLELSPA